MRISKYSLIRQVETILLIEMSKRLFTCITSENLTYYNE